MRRVIAVRPPGGSPGEPYHELRAAVEYGYLNLRAAFSPQSTTMRAYLKAGCLPSSPGFHNVPEPRWRLLQKPDHGAWKHSLVRKLVQWLELPKWRRVRRLAQTLSQRSSPQRIGRCLSQSKEIGWTPTALPA
jgi:hypothetical protein